MKISTMRLLDRRVGVPLCLGLTGVRRVADGFSGLTGRSSDPGEPLARGEQPPKVLLVKLAEMGSTVMALPAIKRLQARCPDVQLHYLCFKENRAVLDLLPGVEWAGVHTVRTDSMATVMSDCLSVLRRLRSIGIDYAVDLEIFSRGSAALVYASGARYRVGFHRYAAEGMNCGDLFTHRLTYNFHLHTAGAFMALFEAIGEPTGDVPLLKKPVEPPVSLPQFEPTEEERRSVRIKLEEGGLPADGSGRVVILNANASDLMPLRRWDTDRFRQLAHRIVDYDDKIYIALTGAPSEQPAIEQLAQRIGHPRVIMMAGKTTLREVVTLYGLSEVLITNDSGPAHFAALTPVKIISLFGPETPNLYRPVSPNNESITANLACSPCIHVFNARDTACTDNQCMQMITVDDVFEAFRRAYER